MYTELPPHQLLTPYVETYWIIDDAKETKTLQNVLPDGCVDIIVSLGDSSIDNGFTPNMPYIFGTHSSNASTPCRKYKNVRNTFQTSRFQTIHQHTHQ